MHRRRIDTFYRRYLSFCGPFADCESLGDSCPLWSAPSGPSGSTTPRGNKVTNLSSFHGGGRYVSSFGGSTRVAGKKSNTSSTNPRNIAVTKSCQLLNPVIYRNNSATTKQANGKI